MKLTFFLGKHDTKKTSVMGENKQRQSLKASGSVEKF